MCCYALLSRGPYTVMSKELFMVSYFTLKTTVYAIILYCQGNFISSLNDRLVAVLSFALDFIFHFERTLCCHNFLSRELFMLSYLLSTVCTVILYCQENGLCGHILLSTELFLLS